MQYCLNKVTTYEALTVKISVLPSILFFIVLLFIIYQVIKSQANIINQGTVKALSVE